jgi:DNA-binding transcriptional MerR regulator
LVDLATSETEEPMDPDELTPGEVARELNVSPATVRRWEASGILAPARRLPSPSGRGHRRYSRASVEALKRRIAGESTTDK